MRKFTNLGLHLKGFLPITTIIFVLLIPSGVAFSEDDPSPEEVMTTFLNSFVAYDYETCGSLLADDATITIIRREGDDNYEHSFQSAAEWLDKVGESGVKGLDSFTVEIHDTNSLEHQHGAIVMLKFSAKGNAEAYGFLSSGFDTGNLILTTEGWRILHYSSFEEFRDQTDTPHK